MKKASIAVLLSIVSLFAQSIDVQSKIVSKKDVTFQHGTLAVTQGVLLPQLNLQEVLDITYSGGLLFRTDYGESSKSRFSLLVSRLDAKNKPVSLWYIRGRAGLDYMLPLGASVGSGLGISFVRTRDNQGEPLMLDDNESDFGFYTVIRSPEATVFGCTIAFESSWDVVLTEPTFSHFLYVAGVAEVELW